MSETLTLTPAIIRTYAKLAVAQRDMAYATAEMDRAHRETRSLVTSGASAGQIQDSRDGYDMADDMLREAGEREKAAQRELDGLVLAQHLPLEASPSDVAEAIEAQL